MLDVASLYMPQRASQRKFGKSLKLHLAKQKKQKLEETWNWCMLKRKVYRERERLFWRSAKRKHQGEREKSCWYVSGCVFKKSQKQETRGWESLTKPGVPREQVQGLHSYIRQRGQLSYSIKSQLQEEKEARLNKTPEKEARGNMKLMYEEEKNE